MKYISVDSEFTNLNIEESQILEFAAIIEDTTKKLSYEDCPKFHCYINQKNIKGDIIALGMNIDNIKLLYEYNLIKDIQQKKEYKLKYNILNECDVVPEFYKFLVNNNMAETKKDKPQTILNGMKKTKLLLAGKNLQKTDIPLLKKLPYWEWVFVDSHRIIDPSVLFIDWYNDIDVPSLSECKTRCGLNRQVLHKALSDAWDIIQISRTQY